MSEQQVTEESAPVRRGPGRPKGSKNKVKEPPPHEETGGLMTRKAFMREITEVAIEAFPDLPFIQNHFVAMCRVESYLDDEPEHAGVLASQAFNPLASRYGIRDIGKRRKYVRLAIPGGEIVDFVVYNSFEECVEPYRLAWTVDEGFERARNIFADAGRMFIKGAQNEALQMFCEAWSDDETYWARVSYEMDGLREEWPWGRKKL